MIQQFVKLTNENPTTGRSIIVCDLFGYDKLASVPSNATAFAHRKPIYNVLIYQRWINKDDDKIVYNWAKNLQEMINQDGDADKTLYVNFENTIDETDHQDDKLKRIYGGNLERLKELKRKYD